MAEFSRISIWYHFNISILFILFSLSVFFFVQMIWNSENTDLGCHIPKRNWESSNSQFVRRASEDLLRWCQWWLITSIRERKDPLRHQKGVCVEDTWRDTNNRSLAKKQRQMAWHQETITKWKNIKQLISNKSQQRAVGDLPEREWKIKVRSYRQKMGKRPRMQMVERDWT